MHGLQIGQSSAQVIPIRPEVRNPALGAAPETEVPETVILDTVVPETVVPETAASETAIAEPAIHASHDPVEAALLADSPARAPRDIPQSDINAVINSAMRFIETPEPHVADLTPVEEIPVADAAPAGPS
ncbi:MAG: hypothetical protein JF571_11335, partial [Asticcacaulis sp.]|nr:hypothetical protein [Asticcacaulis sp.]